MLGYRIAVQENEAKLPAALFLWRKRKCNKDTGLVYPDCSIINDCYSKNSKNQEGIFSSGFISKDTPDKHARYGRNA